VTAVPRNVVLVARDASARGDLARYLAGAGFGVRDIDPAELAVPPDTGSLVWLVDRDVDPDGELIESWLAGAADRSAVLVTWRKSALRALIERFADRLVVLAPPVFGYQLVDALRTL
jgi:hypothetical protein